MRASDEADTTGIGFVVIGRNEGERLLRCFASLRGGAGPSEASTRPIVYVDSGSSDASVANARARGVDVVELDMSVPFTAARARNAGLERLLAAHPGLETVQFIDGDCELQPAWIERGEQVLREQPAIAIVFGRLRERDPNRSVYNALCDIEWTRPAGDVEHGGGIFLGRVEALRAVGGFDPTLIAGEEPDLCHRMRKVGWRIVSMPEAEMALHDAAMTRFGQWWQRRKRAGYTYAEAAYRRWRQGDEPRFEIPLSSVVWGLGVPLALATSAPLTLGTSLSLFAIYPAKIAQIARRMENEGFDRTQARLAARWIMLGKLPEAVGAVRFAAMTAMGRKSGIIEHK
jgi:GT2 family glycosyltransferase